MRWSGLMIPVNPPVRVRSAVREAPKARLHGRRSASPHPTGLDHTTKARAISVRAFAARRAPNPHRTARLFSVRIRPIQAPHNACYAERSLLDQCQRVAVRRRLRPRRPVQDRLRVVQGKRQTRPYPLARRREGRAAFERAMSEIWRSHMRRAYPQATRSAQGGTVSSTVQSAITMAALFVFLVVYCLNGLTWHWRRKADPGRQRQV